MTLSRLYLRQFRSYSDAVFDFVPGITVITGPNGSGKTNILEAIYLLAAGKSFRDHDEALIQHDREWWQLRGEFLGVERELRYENNQKQFYYEGEKRGRFTRSHRLPVVLFEPDDLMMVHGSPSMRRNYLDHLLLQISYGYGAALRRYERALAQRNRLLKQSRLDNDSLFVWDIMLAEEAEAVALRRDELIASLDSTIADYYSALAGRSHRLQVGLVSTTGRHHYKQSLIHDLQRRSQHDLATGFTSVGPHRDDIEFYLDGKHMTTNASRGEVRTLLLALKRFELDKLQAAHDVPPIFLLDDVLSELDRHRQQQLIRDFYGGQIVITATDHNFDGPKIINLG